MSVGVIPESFVEEEGILDIPIEDVNDALFFAPPKKGVLEVATYTVVQNSENEIFCYRRSGGEARLHGLYSIGVGGHVEFRDAGENTSLQAAIRENQEELGISKRPSYEASLYAPVDEVSSEHFGIVFSLESDSIPQNNLDGTFCNDLDDKDLETWSDIIYPNLIGD